MFTFEARERKRFAVRQHQRNVRVRQHRTWFTENTADQNAVAKPVASAYRSSSARYSRLRGKPISPQWRIRHACGYRDAMRSKGRDRVVLASAAREVCNVDDALGVATRKAASCD